MSDEQRVKAVYPEAYAHQWGGPQELEDGWTIRTNGGNGAYGRVGFGSTQSEAWADAASRLPAAAPQECAARVEPAAKIIITFPAETDDPITLRIESDDKTYGPEDILRIGVHHLTEEMDDLAKCAYHAERQKHILAEVEDRYSLARDYAAALQRIATLEAQKPAGLVTWRVDESKPSNSDGSYWVNKRFYAREVDGRENYKAVDIENDIWEFTDGARLVRITTHEEVIEERRREA